MAYCALMPSAGVRRPRVRRVRGTPRRVERKRKHRHGTLAADTFRSLRTQDDAQFVTVRAVSSPAESSGNSELDRFAWRCVHPD